MFSTIKWRIINLSGVITLCAVFELRMRKISQDVLAISSSVINVSGV